MSVGGEGLCTINSTRIEDCVAGGMGGGLMSEGQSVIKLGGCSRLVGNAAGEHGGGIHANGAHMEVSAECLELLSNTAGAQGGGLYYGTQVSQLSAQPFLLCCAGTLTVGGLVVAGGDHWRGDTHRREQRLPSELRELSTILPRGAQC